MELINTSFEDDVDGPEKRCPSRIFEIRTELLRDEVAFVKQSTDHFI